MIATALTMLASAAVYAAGRVDAQTPPATSLCAAAANLAGLGLRSTNKTSTDGIAYTMWSGPIPSWDGLPLSVDLTLPATTCNLPLVSLSHGFGGSKTAWETSSAAGQSVWFQNWNNVALAARGYAVLTMTARGFHDSCGPDSSSDRTAAGLPAACTSAGRHYWIDFDDARYSLRDLQWVIGRLVDTGVADPARVAVSGGSMGGGLATLAAVANDRVMCGGAGWSTANGSDPCGAQSNGQLVRWQSPAGISLHVAAAIPELGWADLAAALAPGGSPSASTVGIPKQSWLSQIFVSGLQNGFYAPAGSDNATNIGAVLWALTQPLTTVTASTPVGQAAVRGLADMRQYRSAISPMLPLDGKVPTMLVQGTIA